MSERDRERTPGESYRTTSIPTKQEGIVVTLKRQHGFLQWFDVETRQQEELFFHASGMHGQGSEKKWQAFWNLSTGDKVRFMRVQTPAGLRAIAVEKI